MPYSHTTWSQLQTQLSTRLADLSQIFWTAPEIVLHLTEAMRTFALCSGFWRERSSFATSANTAFYDINTLISVLAPSVTDHDIIQALQYDLLESTTSQTSWPGTEMFTYADIAAAVQNRLNQFLSDTGIVVTRSVVPVASPPIGRQILAQSVIDVRRVAWQGASPENYYTVLWREDERSLTAFDTGWSVSAGTPGAYSVMAPPPLQLQLAPPPVASGQLELLTVDSIALDPANTST